MMYDTPYHPIPQIAQKSPMVFSMDDIPIRTERRLRRRGRVSRPKSLHSAA